MARKYTKVEQLTEIVRERHHQGESCSEIASSYGLEKKQLKSLMERQRRKERMRAAGYILRARGRPRKGSASEEVKRSNEVVLLRMEIFCPKLEGGEAEVSCDRELLRQVQRGGNV